MFSDLKIFSPEVCTLIYIGSLSRGMFQRNGFELCLRGMFWRNVLEECFEGIFWRNVLEECFEGMFSLVMWTNHPRQMRIILAHYAPAYPGWKNCNDQAYIENLGSLGIMGAGLKTLWNTSNIIIISCGFKEALDWLPIVPVDVNHSSTNEKDVNRRQSMKKVPVRCYPLGMAGYLVSRCPNAILIIVLLRVHG